MAIFGFLFTVGWIWMHGLVPLFEYSAVFRCFVLFLIVSVAAMIAGGIVTYTGGPHRLADEDTPTRPIPAENQDLVSGD